MKQGRACHVCGLKEKLFLSLFVEVPLAGGTPWSHLEPETAENG